MESKKIFAAAAVFLPCLILSAQFSTEFSSEDGCFSGDLASDSDWQGTPETYMVDTSESGILKIDAALPFRVIRYAGSGGSFEQDSYKVSMVFSLKFEEAQSASVEGGAVAIGFVQFENSSESRETAGASLRQVSGGGPGVFNLFVINTFNETNNSDFAPRFEAYDLGLSYDGSGNWEDGISDPLGLVYELRYEDGEWIEEASLTNLKTSALLGTASLKSKDEDGSFAKSAKAFRINSDKMNQNPVTVDIDSLVVEAE